MKIYRVDFMVNGKVNKHGLFVTADCIDAAISSARKTLHNVLDGFVSNFDIVSVFLEK